MLSSITTTSGKGVVLAGAVTVLAAIVSWATARSITSRQMQLVGYARATVAPATPLSRLARR